MGIGDSPIGTGPFGLGSLSTVPAPSGFQKVDPKNGHLLTGRYIDPATGRYVFDADGRILGMPSVQQKVLLAYATVKGSSALPDLGDAISQQQTVSRQDRPQYELDAVAPIQSLIDDGSLEVIDVSVEFRTDGLVRRVRWRDLTTGNDHTTEV